MINRAVNHADNYRPLTVDYRLRVVAEVGAADYVNVRVLLALQRVKAEVGEQTEAVGTVTLAHLDGGRRHTPDVSPELRLAHVPDRYRQQHHGYPAKDVAEDDHMLVAVEDIRRLAPIDYFAEDAIRPPFWSGSGAG